LTILLKKKSSPKEKNPSKKTLNTTFDILVEIFNQTSEAGDQDKLLSKLRTISPTHAAFSICTVEGKVFNYGDFEQPFPLKECAWPFFYIYLLNLLDTNIHSKIGKQVAQDKNTIEPVNPFIMSGELSCVEMFIRHAVKKNIGSNDIQLLELILKYFSNIAESSLTHHLPSLLSDQMDEQPKELLKAMIKEGYLNEDISIEKITSLFYQINNICANTKTLSMMAATLAFDGISPISQKRIFKTSAEIYTLLCEVGLGEYTNTWIADIGYPAISSKSGCMFIFIPGQLGLSIYSPLLNESNFPTKGIEFCKLIKERFGDFSELQL